MPRWSRRWWKSRGTTVAFVLLALATAVALWRVEALGRQGRRELCQAINRDRAIDRATLRNAIADTQRLTNIPGYGPMERQRAIARLQGEIAARAPLSCDRVESGAEIDEPPANLPNTGG